jgi:hypothetical protein
MDPRTHITDLFVFQTPSDANKTVIALNVNPRLESSGDAIDPAAVYELDIDADGDAVADAALRVRFSQDGRSASVQLARGGDQARDIDAGDVIIKDAPVSSGGEGQVTTQGEYRFFAGPRSDPFFADFKGAQNNFQWTGEDWFAELDVFAIVIEFPNSLLGQSLPVGILARVLSRHDGEWVQNDRLGRPAIDFSFNMSDDDKREFNAQPPTEDAPRFRARWAAVFEQAGGHPHDEADELAGQLVPDLLTYDYTVAGDYPNGRSLRADVINMGLAMLSGGKVPHDGLRPHDDLLSEFPFLGRPHAAELSGQAAGAAQQAQR